MKNVLIVEDDRAIREMMTIALELEGYGVQTAGNGKEALEVLQSNWRPQLILLDLMMPIMDGWQFLERKNADAQISPIPVVVVSAFSDRAKDLPCQGLIEKPVELDQLIEITQQHCA